MVDELIPITQKHDIEGLVLGVEGPTTRPAQADDEYST